MPRPLIPHFSFVFCFLAGFDEAGSRQSFQKTDRNGDGMVDMSEFLKFLLELQQAEIENAHQMCREQFGPGGS